MSTVSYARHRFPPAIIQHAVWLYFRFALNYRDVENLLAERGIDVSCETVRRWALKFGRAYAARIRRRRPRPSDRWHLDEFFIRFGGKIHYLWRAVDDEGEVLDIIMQPRGDRKAALKLMRRLLKWQGYLPDAIVTDRLRSYGGALRDHPDATSAARQGPMRATPRPPTRTRGSAARVRRIRKRSGGSFPRRTGSRAGSASSARR